MTELTLSTPSILFSAISLILLAYTNRFLSYAQLVRTLKADYDKKPFDHYPSAVGQSSPPALHGPFDAAIWCQQPVVVCGLHLFDIHWFTDGCRLHVWSGIGAVNHLIGHLDP